MPPVGLEPAIPAREMPQTHALDHAATWIGTEVYLRTSKRYGMKIRTNDIHELYRNTCYIALKNAISEHTGDRMELLL
jgi:hypothetical protein